MSTTLKSKKEVAIRKKHQCFACYRIFPIGTKMDYWAGIVDGSFSAVYTCTICAEIMTLSDSMEDGFESGFVEEELREDQTPEELLEEYKQEQKQSIKK